MHCLFGFYSEDKEECVYSFQGSERLFQDGNGAHPQPSMGRGTMNKPTWSYSCGVPVLGRIDAN